MEQVDFKILLNRYLTGELDLQQKAWLRSEMDKPENQETVEAFVREIMESDEFLIEDPLVKQRLDAFLDREIQKTRRARIRYFTRYAAAAVILFAVAGAYFLLQPKKPELLSQAERFKNDVAPGKIGAVLKLENGQTILLDTAANGKILGHFTKSDEAVTVTSDKVLFATLETPISRTETLNLPDGSTVWLNAASSIRFPTAFSGKQRVVEVTGEVYFKVAHDGSKPFLVKVQGQEIEDIGTEFNVNAYNNETVIRTTLVEGAVKVTGKGNSLLLKPGQQSSSDASGKLGLHENNNLDEILAWKNGFFRYDGVSIEDIMKQVTRWYGVDVVYQEKVQGEFVARIPRNVPVSQLLSLLEETGHIHFKVEDKTITVMK